jgi:hypothetical protein
MMSQLGALMAGFRANQNMNLRSLSERQPRLCSRLGKFGFLALVEIVSGLLTQPQNHAATLRIEALIHLAAMHSRGHQTPTLSQVREWLNVILVDDAIGHDEDPIEDVFVSNASSFRGDIRIFEGAWQDSGRYLTDLMAALLRMRGRSWVNRTLEEVTALLGLSEAMAEKAGVGRYATGEGLPRQPVGVTERAVEAGRSTIEFTIKDLLARGLAPQDLRPFDFRPEDAEGLDGETLGHTALERRPLQLFDQRIIVVLPTAISAAARRHVLEAAQAAGDLMELAAAVEAVQLQDFRLALRNAGVDLEGAPRMLAPGVTAVVGKFDVGGPMVGLFVADDLGETLDEGLQGVASLTKKLSDHLVAVEGEIASREDFRRGLTIFGFGGIGRGFMARLGDTPEGWHRVSLPLGDLARLSWDHEFSALRVWKVLDQEEGLEGRGFQLANVNGFMNLYGYLEHTGFNMISPQMERPGMVGLATDYVAPLRTRIRRGLDKHLVHGPDRTRWVEVHRREMDVFFEEMRYAPLYVSHLDLLQGRLLGCTETATRPWWIEVGGPKGTGDAHAFVFRIWDAALSWSQRLAPQLEGELVGLSPGPISIRLMFPDIEDWNSAQALAETPPRRPTVELDEEVVVVSAGAAAMRAYSDATNMAERWLIAAIAQGAALRAGTPRDQAWADALAEEITGSEAARFVHAIPAVDPSEMLQAAISLPQARLAADEDVAWARLSLAEDAGWHAPGIVPSEDVGELLQAAVKKVWERLRTRLQTLDRRSVVERAIRNHEAIDRDRAEWHQTAAALLALSNDTDDVIRTQNARESMRAAAGMASRAIAEMAICTSPLEGGRPCADADLDALVADLVVMLDCAGQCDAYHFGLAEAPLQVANNMSFVFDLGFLTSLHLPYLYAHQERAFRDAAGRYDRAFHRLDRDTQGPGISEAFASAIREEYGMGLEDLVEFSVEMAQSAIEVDAVVLAMPRSEVLGRLAGGERGQAIVADKAFAALSLKPRARWDEPKPEGARAHDWQPWRMDRKLSLIQRPLVQLDNSADPLVLVTPGLLVRAVRRIFDAGDGRLPAEAFDCRAMREWIGAVVNERGHAFNREVAAALRELGFEARSDVQLTELGGNKRLGDVDVLAWRVESGEVWLIECKRLQFDRTVREIGARLADYTTRGEIKGKRTPIQRHLDRVNFIRGAPRGLSGVTGMPTDKMKIHSALVTDSIVPMQFTKKMTHLVDRVSEYRTLRSDFSS